MKLYLFWFFIFILAKHASRRLKCCTKVAALFSIQCLLPKLLCEEGEESRKEEEEKEGKVGNFIFSHILPDTVWPPLTAAVVRCVLY